MISFEDFTDMQENKCSNEYCDNDSRFEVARLVKIVFKMEVNCRQFLREVFVLVGGRKQNFYFLLSSYFKIHPWASSTLRQQRSGRSSSMCRTVR